MKPFQIFFLFFALLLSAITPASAENNSCQDALTTVDMIECAQIDFDLADDTLNRTYQNLRNTLDKEGRILLRDAQRNWIAFRDAECARQADIVRGGTMAPIIAIGCLTELTTRRIDDLNLNPVTGESN